MKYVLFVIAGLLLACQSSAENQDTSRSLPIDKEATTETVALFNNLKKVGETHLLYGHQDDLAYGHDWWDEPGRSDVKEVTGSYPAIYGWEIGNIRQDTEVSLDNVNFESMKNGEFDPS